MRTLILTASFLAVASASAFAIPLDGIGLAGSSAPGVLHPVAPPAALMAQPASAPARPSGVAAPELSLLDAMLTRPGALVRVVGFVVDGYVCPPCPPGAQCKPCSGPTRVSLKEIIGEVGVPLSLPPTPTLVMAVPDPAVFARGTLYRFEVTTASESVEGVNARMVRFQRADEVAWPNP